MLFTDERVIEIKKGLRGIEKEGPFYAETASVKGELSWPNWIVRNRNCNVLGKFMRRQAAEELAPKLNKLCGY